MSPSTSPSTTPAGGVRLDARGVRVTGLPAGLVAGLQYVLQRGRAGAPSRVLQPVGRSLGRQLAAVQDTTLATRGEPTLAQRTLGEAMRKLAGQLEELGWGRLEIDTAAADRSGLVVARLDGGYWAAMLPEASQPVDAIVAGLLEGYLEHIRGTPVTGVEIGCVRGGEQRCTFVAGAPERIATITGLVGRESAAMILGRLTR